MGLTAREKQLLRTRQNKTGSKQAIVKINLDH
jgi:hypothetical protein